MSTPTTTKTRTSRATRAAERLAADPKPEPVTTIVAGGTGASATGDNRASKTTTAKPKPAPKPKPTAAKPVKVTAAKVKAPAGPTKTQMNREIAKRMVKACADLVANWPEKATGISKEMAAQSIASWLNYAPVPADGWDARLPDRSLAGGRGAKNRQNA